MLVTVLAQDVAVVLVCRRSAELSQEQGGSHGAMGGQDRGNWALLSSVSSQAGPMVSHPSQSLCQHLKGPQKKRRGHNAPRQTGSSCTGSQMRSGPGAPQVKLIGPWHQSQLAAGGG